MDKLYHIVSGIDSVLTNRLNNYSPENISHKDFGRIHSIFFEKLRRAGFIINFVDGDKTFINSGSGSFMLSGYKTNINKSFYNYSHIDEDEITYPSKIFNLGDDWWMIVFHVSMYTSLRNMPYNMRAAYQNPIEERKSTAIAVIFDTIEGMVNFNKDYSEYKVFTDAYDKLRNYKISSLQY